VGIRDLKFVLGSFVIWRSLLFVFLFLGLALLPLQRNFLGGEIANYQSSPWYWAWANFDGQHYLSIAQKAGYGFGQQAFFPLFPSLINFFGGIFGGSLGSLNLAGLIISNVAFVVALVGLYKLLRLEFSERITRLAIILLLVFPVSFYFGSVYTESVFLALVVWSLFLAKKNLWLFACVLGGLAAGTRVIGVLLLPVLFIELIRKTKTKILDVRYLYLLLIPLGLFAYMYYLNQTYGDPLLFIRALPGFGEQRSATPIILPQVFYRYIFKILPAVNYSYFPAAFTTVLEFLVGGGFLILAVLAFKKLSLSYSIFLALGYLVPTLSGSFSSLPRYCLVLFPAFILGAIYLDKASRVIKLTVISILAVGLCVATALFVRGYWIS